MKQLLESYDDFENTTDAVAAKIWREFKLKLISRGLDPYSFYTNKTGGQTDVFYMPRKYSTQFLHIAKVTKIFKFVNIRIRLRLAYNPPIYTNVSSHFERVISEGDYIRIYFENFIFIRKHFLPL